MLGLDFTRSIPFATNMCSTSSNLGLSELTFTLYHRDREASKAEAEKQGKADNTKEFMILSASLLALVAFFLHVGRLS